MLKIFWMHRIRLIGLILAIFIYVGFQLAQAMVMGALFGRVGQWQFNQQMIGSIALFLALVLLSTLWMQYLLVKLKARLRFSLQESLTNAWMRQSVRVFQQEKEGAWMACLTQQVKVVMDQSVSGWLNALHLTTSFLVGVIYIAYLNGWMVFFLCGSAILLVGLNAYLGRYLKAYQGRLMVEEQAWLNQIQQMNTCFRAIRFLSWENQAKKLLGQQNQQVVKTDCQLNLWFRLLNSLNGVLSTILQFCLVLFCLGLRMSLGVTMSIFQASNLVLFPLFSFLDVYNTIHAAKPVFNHLTQKLNSQPETLSLKVLNRIEVEDLVFERGKKYLIVGPSGSGKSTLLERICGIRDNQAISYDGSFGVDECSLYGVMMYLTQRPELFPTTIQEQIGRSDLSRFGLSALRNRLDERIDLDHLTLSGGEQERMVLARAFQDHHDWYLMDEPFASLDQESALALEKWVLAQDIGLLMVSHHVQSECLPLYDGIVHVEKDRIWMETLCNLCT